MKNDENFNKERKNEVMLKMNKKQSLLTKEKSKERELDNSMNQVERSIIMFIKKKRLLQLLLLSYKSTSMMSTTQVESVLYFQALE